MALAVSIAVVKEFIFMEKISSTVLSLTFWTMSSVQGQLLLWLTVTVSSIRFHFIDPSRDTSPQRHRGLLGVSVRAPGETLQWWWLVKSVTWPPPSCSRLLAKDSRQRATLLMAARNWPFVQANSSATLEPLLCAYCRKSDAKCVSRHPAPGTTKGQANVSYKAQTAAWLTVFSSSSEVSSGEHSTRVLICDDEDFG